MKRAGVCSGPFLRRLEDVYEIFVSGLCSAGVVTVWGRMVRVFSERCERDCY